MENTVNNDLFFLNLRLGFVFPAVGVEAFEEGWLGTLRKWLPEVKKVLDRTILCSRNRINFRNSLDEKIISSKSLVR